jgi:hypothetical protein
VDGIICVVENGGNMVRQSARTGKRETNSGLAAERVDLVNDVLSRVLSDVSKLGSEGNSRWFFPRGIDLIQFSVDIKTGHLEVKVAGAPQSSLAPPVDTRSGLSANSMAAALEFALAMEHVPPPAPKFDPNAPTPGDSSKLERKRAAVPSLEAVASYWSDSCAGQDSYANNCAHFLSDAFIRAGYTELNPPAACINARCETPAKRPVRARDMWCWFQSKATKTSTQLTKNTGWWAAFQLNETVYWGGHVALFDSNNWKYYGTGWYEDWGQHLYQW